MTNTLYISGTSLWLAALYDLSNTQWVDTATKIMEALLAAY